MRQNLRQRSRFLRLGPGAVTAFGCAILIVVIGLWHVSRAWDAAMSGARDDVANLSRSLAQHATGLIDGIDQTLAGMAERAAADDAPALSNFIRRRGATSGHVRSFAVLDAEGHWLADSRDPEGTRRTSEAGRDDIRWHREHPGAELHIGTPRPDRPRAGSIIPLSRRFNRPDGSFGGIVLAAFDPAILQGVYDGVRLDAQSAIALWRDDGRLLVRRPAIDSIDRDFAETDFFRALVAGTGTSHSFELPGAVDRVWRLTGYERLAPYPSLIVAVGASLDGLVARWRQEALIEAMALGVSVLALIGLGIGLERRERRIRAVEAQTAEAESLFRALFDHATDALFVHRIGTDDSITLETLNGRAAGMLGGQASDLKGRALSEVLPPSLYDQVTADLRATIERGQPQAFELREGEEAGGRIFEVVHVPLRGPDGQISRVFAGARDITHLRAAETAALDANRLLLLAEQMAQVGHWHLDVVSGRLRWSDEVYRIHGRDPATFRPTLEDGIAAYHPEDREIVAAMVANAIERRGSFEFTLRLVRSDGDIRHVQARGICVLGGAGEDGEPTVVGLFGVFSDISQRVRADASVVSSEARYRMLADAATDMVVQVDPAGICLYVSPAIRDLLGREPEALTESAFASLIHPDDQGEFAGILADLASGQGDRAVSVSRLLHSEERWIWVETSLKTLSLPDGRSGGFVASVRNIDERRRADQARRESEDRYRLLADNASDLIVLGHADGRRSYYSPAVTTILGWTVEEAHKMTMRKWVHPDDLEKAFAATAGLTDERPHAKVVYRLRHKAGHYVWTEAAFRLVAGDAGDVRIVTAIRDVTERQEQARHLEQAKAEAEAGARIKAEFLANMSHELRTPLAGMLGTHDLLQSDPSLTPAQRRLVGLAQESSRSLLTIVNDILDFSKIEAGELSVENVSFSLSDLVESCRRLAAEAARAKDLAITVSIAPDVPDWLKGDPTRIRQILLNLATNAVKFTQEGRVLIAVTRQAMEGGVVRVRIAVTDTGIGIAEEAIPSLFERFSQADGSMARRFGGTGLGLAICKRLVALMGGEIGVESRIGEGSTFWFSLALPLTQPERTASGQMELLGASPRVRHILLAEDNRINQEILTTVLERKGHTVTLVENGRAALAAVQAGTGFDVILMDVQMPEMDGLEATAAIRALERTEARVRTPIIALTANAMSQEIERCRSAGTDAHVAKPVHWPDLFVTIDRLCRPQGELAEIDGPVLDEDMLEMMAGVVGLDRIRDLLAVAMREIERRIALLCEPDIEAASFAAEAHVLISLSGQLGFTELSNLCRELEGRATGQDGRKRVPELRAALERARTAISTCPYARAA
ncbi:PAS domain S-box protein [Methylorubrum suomiense]|uniref:histidine kinase n=1 Tax=Methylorubrum suomiense TaxID=144191 RepID=A0ABQ4UW61_9HYPH|nr:MULTISPECIES: PAS domain S-box protein [Methylobacteriaceae]GJE76348.1 Sensor histidine kinase RcsC [Methylorubrum suomiense]